MANRSSAQAGKPPYLVQQIQDNTTLILSNCLSDLFSSCDDLFFDLSSKAASNNEQSLYFESMRELRFKKQGAINHFKQGLAQQFSTLTTPEGSHNYEPTNIGHTENLTLVHNDDLEQEVAIAGMITKARANSQESLYHLTTRLDYLIQQKRITPNNNPLDPQQLCKIFDEACNLFDINIKARIIIYKQFERHIVNKLANVYSSANNLLIEAGILPKITSTVQSQTPQTSSTSKQAEPRNTQHDPTNELGLQLNLAELSLLLTDLRALGSNTPISYTNYSTNPGPVMLNQELLGLLSQTQLSAHEAQAADAALAVSLHEVVNQILSSKDPASPQSLHQEEEDVINLVAMFFDFILDDPSLPLPMQALISRLQIPILKIAIKDKTFFSAANHPARKLINTIGATGIGWDDSCEQSKDRLYKLVSSIVQEILDQYTDNEAIFIDKLEELNHFLQAESRKTALVEKRTSQAQEGQARTKQAKDISNNILLEKLRHQPLPPAISEFLVEQWLQLMVITYLKHGEESPEWLEAVQLIDDLIWACIRHSDSRSMERLEKIKPKLLVRIQSGLESAAISTEESDIAVNTINSTLSDLHTDHNITAHPLSASQAAILGHVPGSGSKSWKEMTALERQQAQYKALTYEYIKKAENLAIGTWISYQPPKEEKTVRCKLAAKIESSDSYLFVNRYGFKALEKQRKEFAYDMQTKRATPLEAGQLFDRAMEAIINNLRRFTNPQPQTT